MEVEEEGQGEEGQEDNMMGQRHSKGTSNSKTKTKTKTKVKKRKRGQEQEQEQEQEQDTLKNLDLNWSDHQRMVCEKAFGE